MSRLRAARERVGLSRAELAARVGLSVATVRRAESHGLGVLSLPSAMRIARLLDVDVLELL